MKKLIILLILILFLLFGCTESNYVNLGQMDKSFNVADGINIPQISIPTFGQNGFQFPISAYELKDENKIMNLFLMDTNFGDQWMPLNEEIKSFNLCENEKCQKISFIAAICYQGHKAGENQNWYYCREMFYRKHINPEGFISPEEIMDINFYIDSRKLKDTINSSTNKIDTNNLIPKEAFGINEIKINKLEDLMKNEKK
jgi:hypothetical protein